MAECLGAGYGENRPVRINVSSGRLRFDGSGGSTLATVVRLDTNEWVVDLGADAVALLTKTRGNVEEVVGTYRMPWQVTVSYK